MHLRLFWLMLKARNSVRLHMSPGTERRLFPEMSSSPMSLPASVKGCLHSPSQIQFCQQTELRTHNWRLTEMISNLPAHQQVTRKACTGSSTYSRRRQHHIHVCQITCDWLAALRRGWLACHHRRCRCCWTPVSPEC